MKIVPSAKSFPLYSENPQSNPLRYRLLFKEGEELHQQTGEFRCKDFFNDLVAWYLDKRFIVYGMDTRNIKLNEEGVYVQFLNTRGMFEPHIDQIINPKLEQDLGVRMTRVDTKECVYLMPREIFNHTKIIGWLMYFIRQCNNSKTLSLEEMLSSPIVSSGTETNISNYFQKGSLIKKVLEPQGLLPIPELRKYAWYYNEQYNSENYYDSYQVHNSGPIQWAQVETKVLNPEAPPVLEAF